MSAQDQRVWTDVLVDVKTQPPRDDERALVQAALDDRTAFAALYARYVDRIYGYLLRRLGQPEDAEDLTSLTFARALARLADLRGGSFAAWLFAIARNAAANHFRHRPASSLDDAADVPANPAADPLAQVLAAEELALARALIAKLPDGQRELLALRVAGRLSNAEIGQVIGKSEDAVKMRLHRLIKLLRKRYLQAQLGQREVPNDPR